MCCSFFPSSLYWRLLPLNYSFPWDIRPPFPSECSSFAEFSKYRHIVVSKSKREWCGNSFRQPLSHMLLKYIDLRIQLLSQYKVLRSVAHYELSSRRRTKGPWHSRHWKINENGWTGTENLEANYTFYYCPIDYDIKYVTWPRWVTCVLKGWDCYPIHKNRAKANFIKLQIY